MSTETRRTRVENGLSAMLQVAGRPVDTFSLAERMARYSVPGVSIAVVDGDEVAWAGGYGERGAGLGPVGTDTLFQAASISKAVAAVGVLALVEHGVIDLDTDVNHYLTSWRLPASEFTAHQPVTVRHLLSHTAGLTTPGFPGYPVGSPLPSVVDVLSGTGAANTPAVESFAVPGTVGQYSGGGSTVVQLLVCDVTGREYGSLMHDLVLAPLGMTDSVYLHPIDPARWARAAHAHGPTGEPLPGGRHEFPELQAAGLWTTATDLARWVIGVQRMLRGATNLPISPAMAQAMVTPFGVGPFGLGPELGGEGALRRFGHSGRNEGYCSHVDGLVEQAVGAAILTNGDGGTTLCGEIRRSLAAEYGWGPIGAPPIELAEVAPDVLASYAGRYSGPFDRPLKIVFEDGELFSPAPYGKRRMLPLTATRFLDEETGAHLQVETDGGRVARIAVLIDEAELMAFVPMEDTE